MFPSFVVPLFLLPTIQPCIILVLGVLYVMGVFFPLCFLQVYACFPVVCVVLHWGSRVW